ncbi:hypothetical protein ACIPUC_13765 [Streptomyces sp. LARHCF249]
MVRTCSALRRASLDSSRIAEIAAQPPLFSCNWSTAAAPAKTTEAGT